MKLARSPYRRCRQRCALRRARRARRHRGQPHGQAGRSVRGGRRHQGRRPALRRAGGGRRRGRGHGGAGAADAAAGRRGLRPGRRCAPGACARRGANSFPRSRSTIAAVTGTSGKTSVAAFTRQIWAATGEAGGQHRHHRPGRAGARGLRLAHHARSGGAASLARRARRRGRHASGDGSLLARPRPAPPRRRADRGRRLHQSQPRPSRLSSDARGLSRRQAAAVHRPRAAARRRRDRLPITSTPTRWWRRRSSGGCGCSPSAGRARASASSTPRSTALRRCSSSRTPARPTACACRWSAPSRSRMRWWRPALRSRPAASRAAVFAALAELKGAKGRLDLVGEKDGAPIFVDYAHKPDALAKALEALRPYASGRLVVVFGCGGDRDAGKRPMMGAIAARDGRPRHRHRRQSAQRGAGRDPRRDPRGGARRDRDRRPRRGDPHGDRETCAAATCC